MVSVKVTGRVRVKIPGKPKISACVRVIERFNVRILGRLSMRAKFGGT